MQGKSLQPADGRSAACPLHSGRLMVVSQVLGGGFAPPPAPQRLLRGSPPSVYRSSRLQILSSEGLQAAPGPPASPSLLRLPILDHPNICFSLFSARTVIRLTSTVVLHMKKPPARHQNQGWFLSGAGAHIRRVITTGDASFITQTISRLAPGVNSRLCEQSFAKGPWRPRFRLEIAGLLQQKILQIEQPEPIINHSSLA